MSIEEQKMWFEVVMKQLDHRDTAEEATTTANAVIDAFRTKNQPYSEKIASTKF